MSTGEPRDHKLSTLESQILRLEARVRRLADKSDKREKKVITVGVGGGGVFAGPPSARPDAAQAHPMVFIEFNEANSKAYFMNTYQTTTGFEWRAMASIDI